MASNSDFFEKYTNVFQQIESKETDRYTSFDYCFTYFHEHQGNAAKDNLYLSCFVLWSYLASWGMLRGSTHLLQKNPHYLEALIGEIDKHKDLYDSNYDFDHWDKEDVRCKILECYNDFSECLKEVTPSVTLITKIMLGVYGCVPAIDTNFRKAFGIKTNEFNEKVLQDIYNQVVSYLIKYKTSDSKDSGFALLGALPKAYHYKTNELTELYYTKAKMVDMYGFVRGMVSIYSKKNNDLPEDEVLKLFENGRLPKPTNNRKKR